MNNDFETPLAALQTYLQAKVGSSFQQIGRRTFDWEDPRAELQPALFIRHIGNEDVWHNKVSSITELDVQLWIYVKANTDPALAPDTTLDSIVKSVRAALSTPDNFQYGCFTLGGAADWCRVSGRTEKDDGANDGQGKAVLPLKITLP